MTRARPPFFAVVLCSTIALAELPRSESAEPSGDRSTLTLAADSDAPLPPPQKPSGNLPALPPQGPELLAPQNAGRNNAGNEQNAALNQPPKKSGKPPEFFAARRQAQIDRKKAAKDRMRQFQAARAEREEKLYQDWHERYLADTPVRVEYWRAQARAYEALATPYYYAVAPPVILPVIPIYAPVYYPPIYSPPIYETFFYWGW